MQINSDRFHAMILIGIDRHWALIQGVLYNAGYLD